VLTPLLFISQAFAATNNAPPLIMSPRVTITAPVSLTATVTAANRVSLAWHDPSGGKTAFVIEKRDGQSGSYVEIGRVIPGTTQYLDQDVKDGATYHYRVKAFDKAGGSSAYSNEATVTTKAADGPFTPLTITVQPLSVIALPPSAGGPFTPVTINVQRPFSVIALPLSAGGPFTPLTINVQPLSVIALP
jgi:hypothetical protein